MPNDAMTKEVQMTNAQLGTWDLELPWTLGIGHWSLPNNPPNLPLCQLTTNNWQLATRH
jgi:hypothetical protein